MECRIGHGADPYRVFWREFGSAKNGWRYGCHFGSGACRLEAMHCT